MAYEGISKSFQTEWIKNIYSPLLLAVVAPFKVGLIQVYAIGPVFLPLLEVLLTLTLQNHIKDSQELFLNFRNSLDTTPT